MSKLIGSDSQQQQGGDNSTNVQTGDNANIQINSGLGYKDVVDIVNDTIEKKIFEIQNSGIDSIRKIVYEFNKELFLLVGEDEFKKCINPSTQISMAYAQRAYIEADGDESIEKIILHTMKERLEKNDKYSKRKLNNILEMISLLSIEEIDYLSFFFMYDCVYKDGAPNKDSVARYIKEKVLIFYSDNFLTEQFYDSLEVNGLVKRFGDTLFHFELERLLFYNYISIFPAKVEIDKLKKIFQNDFDKIKDLISIIDEKYVSILVRNMAHLKNKLLEKGLEEKCSPCMKLLGDSMDKKSITEFLYSIDDRFSKFADKFNSGDIPCKYFQLSNVGVVLAFINCKIKGILPERMYLNDKLQVVSS